MGGAKSAGSNIQTEPFHGPECPEENPLNIWLQVGLFLLALYAFFFSIDLMSGAFKLMGGGFTHQMLGMAHDPLAGLLLGLIATSIVQSSSSTTSITVGLVAAGAVPLELAIPMVMGANIGTTVTSIIVSMGHVTRRTEFRRAFAASTVHDFFNVLAALVLFPIEVFFHPIQWCATTLANAFYGVAGVSVMSPLKAIIKPATDAVSTLMPHGIFLLILALVVLFIALAQMVRVMRSLVISRVEGLFDRVLFRNDGAGFLLGWILTAIVQSSSATTSLIVPLVGAGILSVRRIFTYTLGANLGTTITALLASLATGSEIGLIVALAHMTFNIFGIILFYPLRFIPIGMATWVGGMASRSRRHTIGVLCIYILCFTAPILYIVFNHAVGK